MRGGYLATESWRDASCCVGSLNNSGITVKECAGHTACSSHSQQTYRGACGLKSAVQGRGRRFDQSESRPMAEVSFPVQRKKKRDLLRAGNKSIGQSVSQCNMIPLQETARMWKRFNRTRINTWTWRQKAKNILTCKASWANTNRKYNAHNHAVKSIILSNFKLLQNDPETGRIFSQPPLISFKRDKNVGNFLVRSALKTNEQPGTFKCARSRCKTCHC